VLRSNAKAPSAGSDPSRRGLKALAGGARSLGLRSVLLVAIAIAFLLVPAAQAAAFTFKIDIEGTGSGKVTGFSFLEEGEAFAEYDCSGPPPGGECEANVGGGGFVEVTATPDPGSEFVEWVLTGGSVLEHCGTETTCTLVLGEEDATLTAVFFELPPPPSVAAIDPPEGPTAGGNTVTIEGEDLENVSEVKFDTAKAPIASLNEISSSEIEIDAPQHAAGLVDVRVVTGGGESPDTSADDYTYIATPAVFGVSPNKGSTAGGNQVEISGANLAEATTVEFGNTAVEAPFTENTATKIKLDAPAHAAGKVNVRVRTLGGTSLNFTADDYIYLMPTPTPPANGGNAPTPNSTPPPPPPIQCIVPRLKGKSLAKAKSALTAANCKAGTVSRPKARKGKTPDPLVVKSSKPGVGATLPVDGKVNLKLGPKPRRETK
jgi:IPT/TIG domain/Divergent InlB B-repeat domain/PASTA domain